MTTQMQRTAAGQLLAGLGIHARRRPYARRLGLVREAAVMVGGFMVGGFLFYMLFGALLP